MLSSRRCDVEQVELITARIRRELRIQGVGIVFAQVDVRPLKALRAVRGREDDVGVLFVLLGQCPQAALGKPDRDRLVAFMGTFLDGLAELLEQSPAPTAALLEMHKRLLSEVEKTKGVAVRDRLEALLLPPDTSIGVVWRSIQEHRNG